MTPTRISFLLLILLAAPCGAAPWSIAFGTSLDEEAFAVAGSTDGTILVGGTQRVGTYDHDALLACFDARGTLRWQKRFGGTLEDAVTAASAHPQGGWVVAGTRNGTADARSFVARVLPDGSIPWERSWPGRDANMAVRRDGSVVVASTDPGRITAFDARGFVSWRRGWQGVHGFDSMDAAADGSIVFTSAQAWNEGTHFPMADPFVALLGPEGTLRWAWRGTAWFGQVRFTRDGTILTTAGGGHALLALDGSVLRFRNLTGTRPTTEGMVKAPTGGVLSAGIVHGSPYSSSEDEAAIVKLKDDLTVQTALVTRRAGEDRASAIAMLSDASTVLVGSTQRGGIGDRDIFITRFEPLVPSAGACDFTTTSIAAEPLSTLQLAPLALVAEWPGEPIQSVRDPVRAVNAQVRPPCR